MKHVAPSSTAAEAAATQSLTHLRGAALDHQGASLAGRLEAQDLVDGHGRGLVTARAARSPPAPTRPGLDAPGLSPAVRLRPRQRPG